MASRPSLFALSVWSAGSFGAATGCRPDIRELAPITGDYACHFVDECAIAVGGEVALQAQHLHGGNWVTTSIGSVAIDPQTIAGATIENGLVIVHTLAAGTGQITAEDITGESLAADIRVVPVESTDVELLQAFDSNTALWGGFAVFRGTSVDVIAKHRDSEGKLLLGHGIETWAITGGTLQEIESGSAAPGETYKNRLVRTVVPAADATEVSVTAGSGDPFVIDVALPGSTARLELASSATFRLGEQGQTISVRSFADDGQAIYGDLANAVTAEVTDSAIARSQVIAARTIAIDPIARGTTSLVVSFDGIEATFPITIE
ncbi:MAG: hypothetical protein AB7O24_02595 [Kofleriaceae bacterium]